MKIYQRIVKWQTPLQGYLKYNVDEQKVNKLRVEGVAMFYWFEIIVVLLLILEEFFYHSRHVIDALAIKKFLEWLLNLFEIIQDII